jgi:hypothetical protein
MLAFTILGLPAHPLIVHGAVVGIPLAALGALAYVLRPSLRPQWWGLFAATMVVAWIFTILAGSTGEDLQHAMKHSQLIRDHAHWADRLGFSVHVLGASFLLTLLIDQARARGTQLPGAADILRKVAAPLAVIAAVAALGLVAVTGHAGAKAAWHNSPAASAGN